MEPDSFHGKDSERTEGNGHKSKYRKTFKRKKKFFPVGVVKHCDRLPRESGEYPFLQISKLKLDTVLSNLC